MKKLMVGLLTIFAAIIIGGIYLFAQSAGPIYQAEAETEAYISNHADIKQVNDFYLFNGADETYFTADAFNSEGDRQIVIVRQSDGAIDLYDFEETISEYDAYQQVNNEMNPSEILNLNIGLDEFDRPVWEVSFKDANGRLGYYYLHLLTGENLRTVTNL